MDKKIEELIKAGKTDSEILKIMGVGNLTDNEEDVLDKFQSDIMDKLEKRAKEFSITIWRDLLEDELDDVNRMIKNDFPLLTDDKTKEDILNKWDKDITKDFYIRKLLEKLIKAGRLKLKI